MWRLWRALNIDVLAAGKDLRGHGSPKPSIEGGVLHDTRSHNDTQRMAKSIALSTTLPQVLPHLQT